MRSILSGLLVLASAQVMAGDHPRILGAITDPSLCPGSPGVPLGGVIPHFSTHGDATRMPYTATLWLRAGKMSPPAQVLKLCAFSPGGKFIGGSVVEYLSESRMWFNQHTGSQGISIAKLLLMSTEEMNYREVQLYYDSSSPMLVEHSISGNDLQTQALSRAPVESGQGLLFPSVSGFAGGINTVLFISRSDSSLACEVGVRVQDQEAADSSPVERRLKIRARGMARVDIGTLAPQSMGAVKVWPVSGSCGGLFVTRETTYRSDAFGGKGLYIDVQR